MKQAAADADSLIVRTAIDVVVVGTESDVDMLILLTQLSSSDNHLYLFKPDSGKYSNNVYNISDKRTLCVALACNARL